MISAKKRYAGYLSVTLLIFMIGVAIELIRRQPGSRQAIYGSQAKVESFPENMNTSYMTEYNDCKARLVPRRTKARRRTHK